MIKNNFFTNIDMLAPTFKQIVLKCTKIYWSNSEKLEIRRQSLFYIQ